MSFASSHMHPVVRSTLRAPLSLQPSGIARWLGVLSDRPHVPRATAALSTSAAATGLADWVRGSGGSVEGVAVESGAYGLALRAQGAVSAGAQLVVLPQACHLTYQASGAGAADPRLLALIEQVPPELWAARLALPLLAERLAGESSRYAPYISRLPAAIEGVPTFFGPEAISALQYPPLSEQVPGCF